MFFNRFSQLAVASLLLTSIGVADAAPVGPLYPPPGGNDFASTGGSSPASAGGITWEYSNLTSSAFDTLYFGLNQVDYGPAGAGLNGSPDAFSLFGVSGTTAEWRATTTWKNDVSGVFQNAATRMLITITGLGPTPWTTDLAGIGLDDIPTYGELGAVVDNSAGQDFVMDMLIEGNTGSGWVALNDIRQRIEQAGKTRSSVATGFYYTEAVHTVPVAGGLPLIGLGLMLLSAMRRKTG